MTTTHATRLEADPTPPFLTDLSARLDELRFGRARPLPGEGLDWLAGAFLRWYPAAVARPFLFATPESGLQATWSLPPFAASLDIDLATRSGRWSDAARHDRPRDLDLTSPAHWAWLVARIRHLGSTAGRLAVVGC